MYFFLQTVDLQVDESSFTGEAEPATKFTSTLNEKTSGISARRNLGFMGTLVRCGRGKVCLKPVIIEKYASLKQSA